MNRSFKNDADRLLSDLSWGREDRRAVYAALEGDKPKMRKKLDICIAFALAVTLLGAVALAIGFRKSDKQTTMEGAQAAITEKYGLTTKMLRLYSCHEPVEAFGVTVYVFNTYGSEFINVEKAGTYTVIVNKNGDAKASWTHDNVDPALYASGELSDPVWGAKQLQAMLDRYNYYNEWKLATPKLSALPIAEQQKRVSELYAAAEPIRITSYAMPQAPGDGDIAEDEAIALAKAYILDNYGESTDGWDIYRSFETGTDGSYYDLYFAPADQGSKYWLRVMSPSGEIVPQEDYRGAAAGIESEPTPDGSADAIAKAEAELVERYGIAGDMLGLFHWEASLSDKDGAKAWTVVLRPIDRGTEHINDTVDWRWLDRLQEKLGTYTFEVSASGEVLSSVWSLEGADGGEYTATSWGKAKAYNAQIIGWVMELLNKNRPIGDKYPHDQLDWFSVADAAAYDQAFRDAGFEPEEYRYNHALPKEGDISEEEAKAIAIQAMLDTYELKVDAFKDSHIVAEYLLNNGGTWSIGFYNTDGMGFVEIRATDGEIQRMNLDSGATGNG